MKNHTQEAYLYIYVCMYVSSIKISSGRGSKFWYIFVDEAIGLKQSIFTPTKSELAILGLLFLKKIKNKGINVRNI